MSLMTELAEFKEKDLVVIMADGRGYRGRLLRYDDEILVLKDVYETANQDVDERGFMFWRRVLHSKVILRVPQVMRLWPWDAPRVGAGGSSGSSGKV